MFINFFTLNLGKSSISNKWKEFFELFFNDDRKIDENNMWVFCTQEDIPNSIFMSSLTTYIGGKFNIYEHSSYSCRNKFNIKMMIITHINNQITFENPYSISIEDWITKALRSCDSSSNRTNTRNTRILPECIKRFVSYKAAIFIPIKYNGIPITFVGAHFPFNSKDEFDKVCIRKNTLIKIRNAIKTDIGFIMGDLNFRMENAKDQLTTLLEKNINLNNATNIENLSPTCKTLTTEEKEAIPLLKKLETKNNCDNKKYNCSRTPSYCDRVLYKTNEEYSIIPIKSEVITIKPIDESDHDGVYVKLKLELKK